MTTLGEAISTSFEDFGTNFITRCVFIAGFLGCIISLLFIPTDLAIDHALTHIILETIVFFISSVVLLSAFYYWNYTCTDISSSILRGILSSIAVLLFIYVPFLLLNVLFKFVELGPMGYQENVLTNLSNLQPASYIPPIASAILVITFFLPFCICALKNYCDNDRFSSLFNIREIWENMYGEKGGIHIASFFVGLAIFGITFLLAFFFQGFLLIIPIAFLFFFAPVYPFLFFEWSD